MIHDHDQDWLNIRLSGIDIREAVAEAIRTGEPVNVHVFPQGPELPVGAEVAHFPGNHVAWVYTNSDADCYNVPYDWSGSTVGAVVSLLEGTA